MAALTLRSSLLLPLLPPLNSPPASHHRPSPASCCIDTAQLQSQLPSKTAQIHRPSAAFTCIHATQLQSQLPIHRPAPASCCIHATQLPSQLPSKSGQILRLVLSNPGRSKLNPSSDRSFYAFPRLVKHVDEGFLDALTSLYRERIPPDAEILDLMSSWVSHLPPEIKYKRVVGHGLNAVELSRNPRLDYFFVKDLNEEQKLEMADCCFDAVLCTVSVQYLEQPERVFSEVYRVLRPGGVCIVSFSNRMFYEKAIAAWRDGSAYSRTQLVVQYFLAVAGFTQPEVVKKLPAADLQKPESNPLISWLLRLLPSAGGDPFYAVIAYRNYKPTR